MSIYTHFINVFGLREIEIDIICMYIAGVSGREIGNRTGLSNRSIEAYLLKAKKKIKLKDRFELTRYLHRNKLLNTAVANGYALLEG